MAAFATTADLAALLQRTLTAAETAAAALALDLASAAIRNETKQTISYVAAETVVIYGTWSARLELPERPVKAVTAVSIAGNVLAADLDFWWPGKGSLLRGPKPSTGQLSDSGRFGDWGGPEMPIQVIYSHGLAATPDDVRAVCLHAAAREVLTGPITVRSESIGGYSASYDNPEGIMLTDRERGLLVRYGRSW